MKAGANDTTQLNDGPLQVKWRSNPRASGREQLCMDYLYYKTNGAKCKKVFEGRILEPA